MINIYKKYEGCILPFILILVFAIITICTWGKWGHLIHDCFREAVIPQALLDGKILYKDITNLYPPLAYQFNAFLYLIFGNSLNVLYLAGIINTILILSIVYFLIRKHSSHLTAFIVVLSTMEIFAFKMPYTTASWFFPYSYSFIYAFSSCLLGFLAYILYKENNEKKYLLLSFFFAGLSAAFKLDFILFVLLPLYGAVKILIKEKSAKTIFYGAILYFLPMIVSLGIFIIDAKIKGFSGLEILFGEINFLMDFSKAPSVVLYNREVMPQAFSLDIFKTVIKSFGRFLFASIIIFTYTYLACFLLSKVKNALLKILFGIGLFGFGYAFIITCIVLYQFSEFSMYDDMVFLSYFVTISAFVILVLKFIKKIDFKEKEKFYILTTVFALLISFRSYAIIYTTCIGNFILIVWWLLFVYFFLEMFPKRFPKMFQKDIIKKSLNLFFIAYGLCFALIYFFNGIRTSYEIKSNKGTYYASVEHAYTINEAARFIEANIPKDASLLVLEEGLVLNYLTDRKSDLKYYALIPHMIDTYGEKNIINELKQNPPDYIFISNHKYLTEAGGYFGIDYAKNICAYILENYDFIQYIKDPNADAIYAENNLEFSVFKLR